MLPAMTRRHDITLLSGAIVVSALGDFLALIPLALALQRTTGSGVVVAGLFIALWTPVVALAGPAGVPAARGDPRRIVIAAAVGQAAVATALAFADSTVAILGLAALLGCGTAVAQPAESALVSAVAGGRPRARVRARARRRRRRPPAARERARRVGAVPRLHARAAPRRHARSGRRDAHGAGRRRGERRGRRRRRRRPAAPQRSGSRPRAGPRPGARRPRLPDARPDARAGPRRRVHVAAVHDRVRDRRSLLRDGRARRGRLRLRRADDGVDRRHGPRRDGASGPRPGGARRDGRARGDGGAGRRAGV